MSSPTTFPEWFGIEDKVALIVGGGYGMGETIAKHLARAGCHLVIADIIPERAEKVAADIRAMGRKAHAAIADMCDREAGVAALEKAEADLGGIDIMVSIVGEAAWVSFLDTTDEQWDLDMRRNVEGFWRCSQYVGRSIARREAQGGAILAIASVDGIQSSPMHAAYGVAKAGLISLVKTMAVELSPYGIRTNAIAPGTVKTPRSVERSPPGRHDRRAKEIGILLGRAATTEEIADAALFLVSDMSRYITGVTLPVDGGWMAARMDVKAFLPKEGEPWVRP